MKRATIHLKQPPAKVTDESTLEEMLLWIGENCIWTDSRAPSRTLTTPQIRNLLAIGL